MATTLTFSHILLIINDLKQLTIFASLLHFFGKPGYIQHLPLLSGESYTNDDDYTFLNNITATNTRSISHILTGMGNRRNDATARIPTR